VRRRRRPLVWIAAILSAPLVAFFLLRFGLAVANLVLERKYPPPGEMIVVSPHRLHFYCQGAGSPTVVIDSGLGVDWVGWTAVIAELVKSAEVCVYDRAGYGWSEAGPMPRTAQQSADELYRLLINSKRPAPFVLVAHSWSGYVARVYAGAYFGTLAGVVLVDPSDQDPSQIPATAPVRSPGPIWTVRGIIDRLPPLGWDRLKRLHQGESVLPSNLLEAPIAVRHRAIIRSSLDQLTAEQSELDSRLPSQLQADKAMIPPDLPFIVITPSLRRAGKPPVPTTPEHRERHRRLAASAALGQQIFAGESGHFVQLDQPDLIVRVVRDLVDRARQGRDR
jgi:pimeloyl-ACP methyl ester carboxylesterase